jgi:hypothetical protein
MKNIRIPEPCHENWADFTPTQKAAFCGSCQIDVVDFSNKTPEEVKQILKDNAGQHLCGRFKKSQLIELNDEFSAWENQSTRSFQSKFLYACLIVFGMSLFSSCHLPGQHVLGEIQMVLEDDQSDNTQATPFIPAANHIETDTTKKLTETRHIKGKVKYVPEEHTSVETIKCIEPDSIPAEIDYIKGDVAYTPDEDVLGNFLAPIEDTVENIPEDTLFDDLMVDGEIEWTPAFNDYIEDTTKTNGPISVTSISDNSTPIVQNNNELIFESLLFPNPSKDVTSLVIQVLEEEIFDVYLYAIDGKNVKSIYNGLLSSGRCELLIDLSSYKSGSYLIVIQTKNQKASLRLEKID